MKNCIAPAGIRTRVLWFTRPVLYPIELKGIPSSRVSIKRLVRTNTCDIFPLHEESRPRDWRYSRTFASLTRNSFATKRNTESTLERQCHRCKYNCEKLYCTRRDSNSGPLVYETSALPIELKGIPSSRVSIKRLIRTNTCDTPITLDECHAWYHLYRFRRTASNGNLAKNSKWKYVPPRGIKPATPCFPARHSFPSAIGPVEDVLLKL